MYGNLSFVTALGNKGKKDNILFLILPLLLLLRSTNFWGAGLWKYLGTAKSGKLRTLKTVCFFPHTILLVE